MTRHLARQVQIYQHESHEPVCSIKDILEWDDDEVGRFMALVPKPLSSDAFLAKKQFINEVLRDQISTKPERHPEHGLLSKELDGLGRKPYKIEGDAQGKESRSATPRKLPDPITNRSKSLMVQNQGERSASVGEALAAANTTYSACS
jgi:hypothetical protein